MLPKLRPHLSYANVMASIAVFIALGGTSVAAVSLKKNSVGSKQIKAKAVAGSELAGSAVTSPKVKDRSLLATDFKSGQLPAGARGATGPTGPTGAAGARGEPGTPGQTALWAHLNADGTLARGSHAVSATGTEPYSVTFDRDVSACTAVASPAGGGLQTVTTGVIVVGSDVRIYEVARGTGAFASNAAISVAVFC